MISFLFEGVTDVLDTSQRIKAGAHLVLELLEIITLNWTRRATQTRSKLTNLDAPAVPRVVIILINHLLLVRIIRVEDTVN